MAAKDMTEKNLEAYPDVFADIVSVLLFKGKCVIDPDDLRDALPHSIYKMDGKLHEQERDTAKFWLTGQIRIALLGLENQTAVDADVPIRIIGYDGAAYRDQMNHDKADKPKERYPVVTLVLYFGYKKRWDKPLKLKECFKIPQELEPFVNNYKVNLFEIAWLPDETINMFKSDFRLVADYFSQKRKNQGYKAPEQDMVHVRAVLELLSAVIQDSRFIDDYNSRIGTKGAKRMDAWLDEAENRGMKHGEQKMYQLIMSLIKDGKNDEIASVAADETRRSELYRQYNIV